MTKRVKEKQRPDRVEFTTFREIGAYEIGSMTRSEPSCFNGIVNVHRYRVTVERIEEPVEVIRERLQQLWDACDNHHHWMPLLAEASKVGLTLEHSTFGRGKAVNSRG